MLRAACRFNDGLETVKYLVEQGAKIEENPYYWHYYGRNKKINNYLSVVVLLDRSLDKTEFVEKELLENKSCKANKLINLLFLRTANLSENPETFYKTCSKILQKCKKNKFFCEKITNNLRIRNLNETIFYKAIVKKLRNNCINQENVKNVSSFFNIQEFRKNLLHSKVKPDTLITTYS
jgi:hypothetical protein